MKRLLLPQGELAQFHDGRFPVRYLAYIELRPGHPRGNHFHQTKEEHVYVISGEFMLHLQDTQSRERACIRLRAGDLAQIPVTVAHSMQATVLSHAIEFSETIFDPSDIHPWRLD